MSKVWTVSNSFIFSQNLMMTFLDLDNSDEDGDDGDGDDGDDGDGDEDGENSSDDDVTDVNSYLSVFNTISKKETEWKLKNGKLVTEILAEGTMKTVEASKTNTKISKAFYNNVIRYNISFIILLLL